ncbi:carbohydrate-binding domain-containing protein [Faecalibacterium prausnitzii]|jgi:hypothetical protein|uniref:carbohydrate-binding domain-containing protein n=1 Tax=Faecalibacterium prausnitzii TaxID=853 RepID=UPI001CC05A10|nr:carbohydrate-binding domain-containing protein [Faecalibacterium prausnitzii]
MLSYRKLAMRVLGRPLHTEGIDSPRPASQRAAAFALTAAMLITLTAPAFADTWCIENGNITVKAGDTEGTNKVSQGSIIDREDTNTIITNSDKDTASSNTVTIDAGNDKVEVTLDNVNIKAGSGSALTSKGDVTLTLKGDNHLTGGISDTGNYGRNGIASTGSLTITGGENGSLTAQGGSGADGGHGGHGIYSNGSVTISGGSTVTANGGNGGSLVGGDGIRSGGGLTVSDGTVTAKGGNGDSKDGYGGDGIRSGGVVTISGNTVNAAGGYGGKVGGYGICSFDRVAISGGTVEAAGGNGSTGGGSGIYSSVIDLSGSLELTAKAGSPNGKALLQAGHELDLDTIKDKLGPGAKVTVTDADGKVNQVSIPRPVEPEEPVIPEESSSSSDGGSATPSTPASPLPGLTVTDKSGAVISYTSTQSGNTLTVCVGRFTASFRISLAALRPLRAEGIETITFQTILCSTTLSVDELLAMGGEDAEAVLTHRSTDSSLTVG